MKKSASARKTIVIDSAENIGAWQAEIKILNELENLMARPLEDNSKAYYAGRSKHHYQGGHGGNRHRYQHHRGNKEGGYHNHHNYNPQENKHNDGQKEQQGHQRAFSN